MKKQPLMKVLFITRKWPPAVGGMETYSMELCHELKSLVDLEVCFLPGNADGCPPSVTKVIKFFMVNILFLWRERNSFDVIHFGDFVLFPLAWLHSKFSPSLKRVITVHGLDLIYGNRKGFAPLVYKIFVSWAKGRRASLDAIITNSQNTSRIVKDAGFGGSFAIPLGVRVNEVSEIKCVDPKERYLLFVGRIVRRKGAGWFVENVLPHLPEDIVLKVVGKIWDSEEGKRLENNPRVHLLGYVDDLQLDMLRSKAVSIVMPNIPSSDNTDVEGFGITALEAAATGTPLIAADIEGLTDAVKHGETGFLVPPFDEMAWKNRITEIIKWTEAERQKFSLKSKRVLEEEYSWRRVAKDTYAVYAQLFE